MSARAAHADAAAHVQAHAQGWSALVRQLADEGVHELRIGWCDLHGVLRGKTLLPRAWPSLLRDGVGLVSTLLLKDSSDRTAFQVFEPGIGDDLPGFAAAGNLVLRPDPASVQRLPWSPGTAWVRGELFFADGRAVPADPRRALQAALVRLAAAGYGLRCGLEVEFHIYRALAPNDDPAAVAWPGDAPRVALLHPGYLLLGEEHADRAHDALAVLRCTAQGLGLPLRSLEIELGPSQFEAVFDATDALQAADWMVLFRNGVRQALARAGYHATFMCRPPFARAMASGWHLHQSLVDRVSGANVFMRAGGTEESRAALNPQDARSLLSEVGYGWLAGLLQHAAGAAVFGCSSVNAFGRLRPNAMAPLAATWGADNRGAMLRVLGAPDDAATRIENRIGEPMANPYLYIASQIHAGLDGVERGLVPPRATEAPYSPGAPGQGAALPASLDAALDALEADETMARGLDATLLRIYTRIKRSEALRHAQAEDKDEWQRREYFARF